MRSLVLIMAICTALYACNENETAEAASYSRSDLSRLSWIEGNWKGMAGSTPFYEIYRKINDSTLHIYSYNWNGQDSIGSSVTPLQWKEGSYYLGDSLNWKVTAITDSSIRMEPHYKAGNSILWEKNSADSWIAILKGKKGENRYLMERIRHFPNP